VEGAGRVRPQRKTFRKAVRKPVRNAFRKIQEDDERIGPEEGTEEGRKEGRWLWQGVGTRYDQEDGDRVGQEAGTEDSREGDERIGQEVSTKNSRKDDEQRGRHDGRRAHGTGTQGVPSIAPTVRSPPIIQCPRANMISSDGGPMSLATRRLPILGIALAGCLSFFSATATPASAQESLPHADDGDGMTLALAGDAIITRRLSVYDEPEFLALRDLIQGATAAFVNLEILLHNFEPDVIPATQSGGTYMQADPSMAEELTWMGFDMVNMANNHTGDYGYGGLRRTTAAVETAGLVHAGTGENLAEARAPGYLETPRGRVAVVAAASTFPDASRAGHQRRDVRGRPGLSPIRYDRVQQVTEDQMEILGDFREATVGSRPSGDRLRLFGETFVVGPEYAEVTVPDEGDLEEIVAAVGAAARQAEFVIFSSHSHERGETNNYPAEFIRTVAHSVIDAGADIFLAHGPHVLRGIELYKGGIIFYSLGDFVFQNETVPRQPEDNYARYDMGPEAVAADFYDARQRTGGFPSREQIWESVVPLVRYEDGALAWVELHPITLGFQLPRPQRGRPLLASGELARKIIGDVQEYSSGYGTEIRFQDGIGVVRIR